MTDLLEQQPAEPRRHRAPRRVPRAVAVLVVAVVLLLVATGGVYAVGRIKAHFASAPDYSGSGSGRVVVQVKPGQSALDVARTLAGLDVVKSVEAFRSAAAQDPASVTLQPGYYQLRRQMSAKAALALLLDPASRLRGRVTVPEGSTVPQTLSLIARGTEIPIAELRAAAARPASLGLPDYAKGLEGFLFPATYDVDPGTSGADVLRTMVARFEEAAGSADLVAKARALGRTPYEVVTVASLIERESRLDEEYPKVARVVYNRLDRGIPLGIDASILFGLGRTSGGLTRSDLARNTPYNTRLRRGLPPTPIASPGDKALRAALDPAEGDWLYYVLADRDGRQLFTADYQEFLRQKAKSQAEGIF